MPRPRLAHVSLALPLLMLVGCLDEPDRTESFRFADDEVASLRVETGSGDIDVRSDADATEAYVEAVVYGAATRVNTGVTAGELRLSHECPKPTRPCGVDWVVVFPASTVARDLDLDTGSGDLRVENILAGHILGESGSGDVSLDTVEAHSVILKSGSGDIDVRVRGVLGLIELATGSGDVSVHLPQGAYDLDVDTGSGDIYTEAISDDRGSAQRLTVSTGSGDVSVRGR